MLTPFATGLVAWAQTNVVLALVIIACLSGAVSWMTGDQKGGKEGIKNALVGAVMAMLVVPVVTAIWAIMPKG